MSKKKAIIVDIDGTIADNNHRTHLIEGKKKDWEQFFEKMVDDKPIEENIHLIRKSFNQGLNVLIVSGRYERHECLTRLWLDKYLGIDEYLLFQRSNKDYRNSIVLKKEILINIKKNFDIKAVMENDKKIIKMYKEQGLNCIKIVLK